MVSVARRILALSVLLGLDTGCWSLLAADRRFGLDLPLTVLIPGAAAWGLQLALAWCTLLVALVALEPVARRELTGYAACPPGVRRVLLLVCGAVALGAVTGPVHAAEPSGPSGSSPHQTDHQTAHQAVHLDGLPLPDRTADRTTRRAAAAARASVTVRQGDSMWRIARQQLLVEHPDRTPSDTEIDRAWRAWYVANHDRVGTDPDLIVPGARLHAPEPPPVNGDPR